VADGFGSHVEKASKGAAFASKINQYEGFFTVGVDFASF